MQRLLAALLLLLVAHSAQAQFLSPGERARDRNLSNLQGQFHTLLSPSISVSTPVISATQTWNNSSTTFTALRITAIDTNSASGSLLADLRVGALSKYSVDKSGNALGGTYNKLTLTPPATGATLTIADGKTVTHSNTTTFAGTDGKTLTINNSGTLGGGDAFTLAIAANKTLTVSNSGTLQGGDAFVLSIAASKTVTHSNTTTFAGTDGKTLTINNSGTLGGGDAFTLAIAANKTLTVSNSLTLAGTDAKSLTLTNSLTVNTNDGTLAFGAASKTLTVNNSITLAGTDATTWTGASTNMTLAALNIADQTVSGGANVTTQSQSTGNITVDCGSRPIQSITNNGAWTITAPSNDGSCILVVTNGASAATPAFSGFSVGSNTGDAWSNTNTNKLSIFIWRGNSISGYRIAAHQ